ncbi:hypothetical protein [Streptomyces chartreusis]|uniref:hypothetical protein n=1 Tax=Streptomyces chartreusis TaxID=1969 RepID=UPI002E198393
MCNQPVPEPVDGTRTDPALWGHSSAAHRVHGWCADCPGRDAAQEAVEWRVRENRRHEAAQAAVAASETRRNTVDLQATHDHLCPVCGQEALTVVTVRLWPIAGEQRKAGGWAHCTACDATPHPTLEDPRG